MNESKEQILQELQEAVGEENASAEKEILFAYARDGMSPIVGDFQPDYLVRPGSREEVQKVVLIAAKNKIPLYPIAQGTNFTGACLPLSGGIQVDMRRMNRIIDIDEVTMSATLEAGVTWGEIRREAKKKGLYLDVPVGPYTGTVVANYCSWNLSHYFSSSPPDKVLSLEIVLPNGEILRTGSAAYPPHETINPYLREAYGPDLTGIFRGSLGAFGIVTKMTIGLHPLFENQLRVDIAFKELEPAVNTLQAIAHRSFNHTFLALFNNHILAVCCAPDVLELEKGKGEYKRVLGLFPNYLITLGLNGSSKQVNLYKRMAAEIATKNEGIFFDSTKLEKQIRENMDDFLPGAGRRVLRLFRPYNTQVAILAWGMRFDKVAPAYRETCRIIEEMGFVSFAGESTPTWEAYAWGTHGRTVFWEADIYYNPEDKEDMQKNFQINQKAMEILRSKYGSSICVYFPPFSPPLMPEYEKLLRGIKRYFDPNGIMSPGRLVGTD